MIYQRLLIASFNSNRVSRLVFKDIVLNSMKQTVVRNKKGFEGVAVAEQFVTNCALYCVKNENVKTNKKEKNSE